MKIVFDIFDWITSFALMVLAVWFLIIITPLINQMRKESADQDIQESWQDVRVSLSLAYAGTKEKLMRKLRSTK